MESKVFRPRPEFERIFDASPTPQLILSPDFTIVGVNTAYLKATMTGREDILGQAMFDVFPDNPADAESSGVSNLRASLVRAMATGHPDAMPLQKYDIRRPAAAGGGFEERWWSSINIPVFDARGRLSWIIHRVEDVTDYVRLGSEAASFGHPQALELVGRNRDLHDAMQAQALVIEHLRLALKAGHAGTFNWDVESGRCHWSEESLALYGLDAFGGRYADWLDCVLPEDRCAAHETIQRALPQGEVELDFRIRRRDNGAVRWMRARAEADFDEGRRVRRVIGIQMDITEHKRLEEQLKYRNDQLGEEVYAQTTELKAANDFLENSNLELRQFAYVAAHDLQTPLRSIVSFAQLLQRGYEGRLDAQADMWLAELSKAARRMHLLVSNLLQYARVDSRGERFVRVSMSQVLNDVLGVLNDLVCTAGARVTARGLPEVMGDPIQLAQVLQNLIENAIKYRGAAPPIIEISAKLGKGEWLFAVRDNGIGIDKKHWESIFNIFRRLHTQEQFPGTGIGLALCRRVVHRHGGRIWVVSTPGRGSTFYFTLPMRQE